MIFSSGSERSYSYSILWYNPVTKCYDTMTINLLNDTKENIMSIHLQLTIDVIYAHMKRMKSTNVMRKGYIKFANAPLTDPRLMNSSLLVVVSY